MSITHDRKPSRRTAAKAVPNLTVLEPRKPAPIEKQKLVSVDQQMEDLLMIQYMAIVLSRVVTKQLESLAKLRPADFEEVIAAELLLRKSIPGCE